MSGEFWVGELRENLGRSGSGDVRGALARSGELWGARGSSEETPWSSRELNIHIPEVWEALGISREVWECLGS